MAKFKNWENKLNKDLKMNEQQQKHHLKKWITESIDENMIKWAEKFGEYLAQKENNLKELSSSQLRKFFGALKALQNEILMDSDLADDKEISNYKHELLMLKPQLAYAAARAKTDYAKIHNFHEIISECIDYVQTKKHFKNFISLVEAIVAYHKVEEESKKKSNEHAEV